MVVGIAEASIVEVAEGKFATDAAVGGGPQAVNNSNVAMIVTRTTHNRDFIPSDPLILHNGT